MPLKERSQWISLLGLVYLFIRTFLIPLIGLIYVYHKENNDGEDVFANPEYKRIISTIDYFTWFGLFVCYILKFARILYVFQSDSGTSRRRNWNTYFENEVFLIITNWILTFIYTIICGLVL